MLLRKIILFNGDDRDENDKMNVLQDSDRVPMCYMRGIGRGNKTYKALENHL